MPFCRIWNFKCEKSVVKIHVAGTGFIYDNDFHKSDNLLNCLTSMVSIIVIALFKLRYLIGNKNKQTKLVIENIMLVFLISSLSGAIRISVGMERLAEPVWSASGQA